MRDGGSIEQFFQLLIVPDFQTQSVTPDSL
jgi:hypothetical protein